MNWLFSFPGSGSNYLRYCVEFLTERSTEGPLRYINHQNNLILRRSHLPIEIDINDKVSLLLRNPFELMIRENILKNQHKDYLETVDIICSRYQSFYEFQNEKKIFYYEDIISQFEKICSFLDFHKFPIIKSISEFEKNLSHHKTKSYELGNPFFSNTEPIYYSQKLTNKTIDQVNKIIESYSNKMNGILHQYIRSV
jgi:hypothetical protein